MISIDKLLSLEKEEISGAAEAVSQSDIWLLIELLNEKDDKIRYHALLLLQSRSEYMEDVFPYWDIFCTKLKSDNSYQRNIGLILLADNVKWDQENKIDQVIDEYLMLLKDDKPITIRLCIQSLSRIVLAKPRLSSKIAAGLMALDLSVIRESMRKLILMDILTTLTIMRKIYSSGEMDNYISDALTGAILDNKSKKQIGLML